MTERERALTPARVGCLRRESRAERWAWLCPRTLPVLVALVGMFAVLNTVNYLSHPPAAAIEMTDHPNTDVQPSYGFHVKLVLRQ